MAAIGYAIQTPIHIVEWAIASPQALRDDQLTVGRPKRPNDSPGILEKDGDPPFSFVSRNYWVGFGHLHGSHLARGVPQAHWTSYSPDSLVIPTGWPVRRHVWVIERAWPSWPAALPTIIAWVMVLALVWAVQVVALPRLLKRMSSNDEYCPLLVRRGFHDVFRASCYVMIGVAVVTVTFAFNPGNVLLTNPGLCRQVARVTTGLLLLSPAWFATVAILLDRPRVVFGPRLVPLTATIILSLTVPAAFVGVVELSVYAGF